MIRYLCFPVLLIIASGSSATTLDLQATIYLETSNGVEVLLDGTTGGSFEFHSWEKHDNFQGEPINILVGLENREQVWIKAWIGDTSTRLSPDDTLITDKTMDAKSMAATTTPIYSFENGARIFVNTTPRVSKTRPESIELNASTMGLNYLCFINAGVVIDDTYQLGRINGFGARFTIDVPDFNLVTFSMRQFDGYEPVGEYYNGLIHIPFEKHDLTINAVRFGPTSQYLLGPFTVYGALENPEVSASDARENAKKRIERRADQTNTLRQLEHIDSMPFAPLNRVSSDLMVIPTAQLEAKIGPWATDLEDCGR